MFPLLELALHQPKTVPVALLKQAMSVIKQHALQAGMSEEYPRVKCIELLEYVIANYDHLQAKVCVRIYIV
mgnify:CR=1 FL=1